MLLYITPNSFRTIPICLLTIGYCTLIDSLWLVNDGMYRLHSSAKSQTIKNRYRLHNQQSITTDCKKPHDCTDSAKLLKLRTWHRIVTTCKKCWNTGYRKKIVSRYIIRQTLSILSFIFLSFIFNSIRCIINLFIFRFSQNLPEFLYLKSIKFKPCLS